MDVYRSRSSTIVLRFDNSGHLDLGLSCVRQNSGLTTDFQSLMNSSRSMDDPSGFSETSVLLSLLRSALADSCAYAEVEQATRVKDMPTAANPAPNISRPS